MITEARDIYLYLLCENIQSVEYTKEEIWS